MPKGVVASRTVQCRACSQDFVSNKAGKASWFCARPECVEKRKQDRRERLSIERRTETPDAAPRPPRAPPKSGPLAEDLAVILRLADHYGANVRVLRESVQAIARGEGDQRYHYRRIAAVSLALAAYIGGRTV